MAELAQTVNALQESGMGPFEITAAVAFCIFLWKLPELVKALKGK